MQPLPTTMQEPLHAAITRALAAGDDDARRFAWSFLHDLLTRARFDPADLALTLQSARALLFDHEHGPQA